MKRMVGRRVVDDNKSSGVILHVVVRGRWPWQQDDFYSSGEIGVDLSGGVLTVTTEEKIRSYAPGQWRTVTSTRAL